MTDANGGAVNGGGIAGGGGKNMWRGLAEMMGGVPGVEKDPTAATAATATAAAATAATATAAATTAAAASGSDGGRVPEAWAHVWRAPAAPQAAAAAAAAGGGGGGGGGGGAGGQQRPLSHYEAAIKRSLQNTTHVDPAAEFAEVHRTLHHFCAEVADVDQNDVAFNIISTTFPLVLDLLRSCFPNERGGGGSAGGAGAGGGVGGVGGGIGGGIGGGVGRLPGGGGGGASAAVGVGTVGVVAAAAAASGAVTFTPAPGSAAASGAAAAAAAAAGPVLGSSTQTLTTAAAASRQAALLKADLIHNPRRFEGWLALADHLDQVKVRGVGAVQASLV